MTAAPFVKWVGGKGSLISRLVDHLPDDIGRQQNVTYVEPFVGGGAMLFYMLTHFPNIKRAIINDINKDLINCYTLIKNEPMKLIASLSRFSDEYMGLPTMEDKEEYYYRTREKYNKYVGGVRRWCGVFCILEQDMLQWLI